MILLTVIAVIAVALYLLPVDLSYKPIIVKFASNGKSVKLFPKKSYYDFTLGRALWAGLDSAANRVNPNMGYISLSVLVVGTISILTQESSAMGFDIAIAGGAITTSINKNKKESKMKTSMSEELVAWLKDIVITPWTDLKYGFELTVKSMKVVRGRVKLTQTMSKDPITSKLVPLKVVKQCLLDYLGLDIDKIGLELFHSSSKLWDKNQEITRNRGLKALWSRGDLVFGSALKGEIKWNQSLHRVKFYMAKSKGLFAQIFKSAADLMSYGTLLLSQAPFYRELMTKVVTKSELDEMVRNYLKLDSEFTIGNDGSCYIRRDVYSEISEAFKLPFIGALQFRAASNVDTLEKMTISKGVQDALRWTDQEFTDLFGDKYSAVLVVGDQIKVNKESASNGLWQFAFTYLRDKRYALPSMWETTMYLKDTPEVRTHLSETMIAQLEALAFLVATRRGKIAYVDKQLSKKAALGENTREYTKLMAALLSNLPSDYKWSKIQLAKMMRGQIHRIIKSQGIEAHGQLALIDNYASIYTRRYISALIAEAIGADDDGDIIGLFWSNSLGKAAYFRYPCISGIVVIDIPNCMIGKYPDHEPDMVDLYDKYGVNLHISRNELKGKPIALALKHVRILALKLLSGLGIGLSTVAQFRFIALGEYKLAALAGLSIESGAISIKKEVDQIACPKVTQEMRDKVDTKFMSFTRSAPESWEKLVEIEPFKEDTKEAYWVNLGIAKAVELYKEFMSTAVHPSVAGLYIDWDENIGGVAVTSRSAEVYDTYIVNIVELLEKKELKLLDEEEFDALIHPILSSVESYGATLTLTELKALVNYASEKAGPKNTGAFIIHAAGARILDVFGAWEEANVVFEHSERASKIGNYRIRVTSTKAVDVNTLRASKETFKVLNQDACSIAGIEYKLSAEDKCGNGWPIGKLELRHIGVVKGLNGIRKNSAILYIRSDASVV
jgi:hypothetical protein